MAILNGFICGPVIYEYAGWLFEFGYHTGPWPLTKEWYPRKRAGRKFYKMFSEWYDLGEKKREQFRKGGGCQPF